MRRTLALAATTTLALTLAACGGDSDGGNGGGGDAADASAYAETAPEQIASDAREALTSLSAVHIEGEMESDDDTITVDLTLTDSGVCEGTMSGPIEGMGTMEVTLLSDGQGRWMKFSDEFYENNGQQGAAMKQVIGDKWVTGSDLDDAFEICSIEEFADGAFDPEDDKNPSVKGTAEVDGEPVVELEYTTDDDRTAVASVLASEPHRIVKVEVGSAGTLTLGEFDETPEVEAPASDDVVDIDQLG